MYEGKRYINFWKDLELPVIDILWFAYPWTEICFKLGNPLFSLASQIKYVQYREILR
jgi:hypothetical protein